MKDMRFAERIKELRKAKGLTMEELGDKLGKAKSSISSWENGIRTPKMGEIKKIAIFFDVDPDYLVGFSNIKKYEETLKGKTIRILDELEEPRQKIVLETASSQLEEQKKEHAKVVSIKTEPQRQSIDLADLVDDSKVDWDKWVSFDGKPLTDEVKEAMKKALGKQLEDGE